MRLHINAFKVTLLTDKGPFGSLTHFDKGLNVIRAENTSGKSAILNGILYALGLEVLVGKRGIEAVKPVFWGNGDFNGTSFNVLESFVEIELTNGSGEVVTIRRYVRSEKDTRLIEVSRGEIDYSAERPRVVEPYFVGIEGAAQREKGFHHFLAEFLELELPLVKRFKGDDVPLYVECIAPLMFIEQIHGWSGIQATLPQSYGIRNVAKVAVEYILKLDVIENEKRRIQISEEANEIREEWRGIRDAMSHVAHQCAGRLMNVPPGPVVFVDAEPWIAIPDDSGTVCTLNELLVSKRALVRKAPEQDAVDGPNYEELKEKLEQKEQELLTTQAELSQLRFELRAEEAELYSLRSRLDFVTNDIQRNKDIKRLRDFGFQAKMSVAEARCPTCNQPIQDSLVPTESAVMEIEDNIGLLSTETEAIRLLIAAGEERLALLTGKKMKVSENLTRLHLVVRDLRSDIVGNQNASVAEIREQIYVEEEVSRLEGLKDEFEEHVISLREVAKRWEGNRARYAELPSEYYSDVDKEKLEALSEKFALNVEQFGYRSTGVSRLRISEDNYRPVCDEFEVAFGASASDNIRLIWAYTLSLFEVSLVHGGNHWGLIVFDEPEQQKMKETSSDALYSKIAQIKQSEIQVIIATSAPEEVTVKRLQNLPHRLIEYGDKVIRPISI